SDGGLAVAAAEMALAAGTGVALEADPALPAAAWFFGEDQGRYLVACARASLDRVVAIAAAAGVPARAVGATGGDRIALGASAAAFSELRVAHRDGFARLMGEA
ncbi:MAG TPA: AIR synthase-related protein, partial [Thermohalobaculum sp.]|nr:AIR synthase-related protein [Thermohalobaculum sp.]